MLDSLFSLIFLPFSFEPVLYCCGMVFIVALFGLVRRFVTSDYKFN